MNDNNNLPPCIIGTWAWGSGVTGARLVFGRKTDNKKLIDTYVRAMEKGFTYWDTAEVYGKGTSERILAECLRRIPGARISTKHAPGRTFKQGAMNNSLSGSCERLGISAPDVYFLHNHSNLVENIRAAVPLLKLKKIRSLGLSNVSLNEIETVTEILAVSGFTIGAVQNHYSLLSDPEKQTPIIRWCQEHNVPFFSYMVLEQGALTGRYDAAHPFPSFCMRSMAFPRRKFKQIEPLLEKIRSLAKSYKITPSQIPIAWARAKGTVPLIGLTRPSHADELAAGCMITLNPTEVDDLEQIARSTGVVIKGSWEP